MKKNAKQSFHLKSGNKIMILDFHQFRQQFSEDLQGQHKWDGDLFPEKRSFYQGVADATNLIAKLYDSGKLVLTYKGQPTVGINNISDYAKECVINSDVDLDEFDYPLLSRYYYSGVKEFLDLMNRDFYMKYRG